MAIVSRNTLLGYLNCSELVSKWTNILDSFRHKGDAIEITEITNLATELVALKSTVITDTNVSGNYVIDWKNDTYNLTLTGATTFSYINLPANVNASKRTITIWITGSYPLLLPNSDNIKDITDYDGIIANVITLECLASDNIKGFLTRHL
jgi:hypothetical protein